MSATLTPAECLIRDNLQLRKGTKPLVVPAAAPRGFEMRGRLIAAQDIGDNVLIESQGAAIEVYECFIWNGANPQTIIFSDGPSSAGLYKLRLTTFPASSGLMLGQGDRPHWVITPGRPLILNLQLASIVDGYINYVVR